MQRSAVASGWLPAATLALLLSAAPGGAFAQEEQSDTKGPIVIQAQGSFSVGGRTVQDQGPSILHSHRVW